MSTESSLCIDLTMFKSTISELKSSDKWDEFLNQLQAIKSPNILPLYCEILEDISSSQELIKHNNTLTLISNLITKTDNLLIKPLPQKLQYSLPSLLDLKSEESQQKKELQSSFVKSLKLNTFYELNIQILNLLIKEKNILIKDLRKISQQPKMISNKNFKALSRQKEEAQNTQYEYYNLAGSCLENIRKNSQNWACECEHRWVESERFNEKVINLNEEITRRFEKYLQKKMFMGKDLDKALIIRIKQVESLERELEEAYEVRDQKLAELQEIYRAPRGSLEFMYKCMQRNAILSALMYMILGLLLSFVFSFSSLLTSKGKNF
ncbi:hypothetical protein SteCoe_4344 [Stentor coeruleus]|uniref:Uncharacterized protein n=1 Tax=Stentor coeruleus TaxID=5963 RepID=A0A1R2CUY2_9CILI|nr:hypothetical protein SteCoe_4344 [Stentor coeruleus]